MRLAGFDVGLDRPFFLMLHHKAPHRSWQPSRKHFSLFDDIDIPEPDTLWDDHAGRAEVVQAIRMRIMDLDPVVDLKASVPPGMTEVEEIPQSGQRDAFGSVVITSTTRVPSACRATARTPSPSSPNNNDVGSTMPLALLRILFASQHPDSRKPGAPHVNDTPTP